MRLFLAFFTFAISLGTLAQDTYPAKTVRVIAPAAPGGNPDVLGRMLGARLADMFGKPFVVENVPGAGGVVAAELLAHAAPDGHVLLLGDSGNLAINPVLQPKLNYSPLRDFAFITALAALPTIMVAPASLPANSLAEFVAAAKAKPGALSYGSAGTGSIHHLTMAVFASRAGIEMLHVPYKGSAGAITGLLSGDVAIMFNALHAVLPQVKAGKINAIAVGGPKRSRVAPDIPTIAESGYPDFDVDFWYGLLVPAATPKDIIAKLNQDITQILNTPEMRETLSSQGLEPVTSTPEQFGALIRSDLARWANVVKSAGITAE